MTPQAILLLAAHKFETGQHTWAQGDDIYKPGHKCAYLLLIEICDNLDINADETVANLLRQRVGDSIVDWNDARGRTREEVIDTLREAAHPREFLPCD